MMKGQTGTFNPWTNNLNQDNWMNGFNSMFSGMNKAFTDMPKFMNPSTAKEAFEDMLKGTQTYAKMYEMWQPFFQNMPKGGFDMEAMKKMFDPTAYKALIDQMFGFLYIAGADMKYLPVEWLAQGQRASERREKRHFGAGKDRQCSVAGWRADVAEQCENLFILYQAPGIFDCQRRLVLVIGSHDLNLPAVNAALSVDLVKIQPCAGIQVDAQLGGRTTEGSGLTQQDTVGGNAGFGTAEYGRQSQKQAGNPLGETVG